VQYDAHYWGDNIRNPVLFERAMASLVADGHTLFLEVGPHPVLSSSIKECLAHHGVQGQGIASLRRGKPEVQTMAEALGALYVCDARVDWTSLYGPNRRYTPLPTYPWQREVHWHEGAAAYQDRLDQPAHALLGRRTAAPAPTWESTLNASLLPYLPDHRVEGLTVLPGAAYVEVGLALQAALVSQGHGSLEHLEFHKALIIGKSRQPRLHATYHEATRQFSIFSREADGEPWTPHATGRLSTLPLANPEPLDLAAVLERCRHHPVSAAQHYEDMTRRGLEYGPFFQGVRELWLGAEGQEMLAWIEGHQTLPDHPHEHLLHPTLLDACFQTLLSGLSSRDDQDVYVPVNIRQVRWHASPGQRFWCHSRITQYQPGSLEGEVTLTDEDGEVLVQLLGIRARALTHRAADALKDLDQWFYEFAWEAVPRPEPLQAAAGPWLVFCDREGAGDQVAERLKQSSGSSAVFRVYTGQRFQQIAERDFTARLDSLPDIEQVLEACSAAGALNGIVYGWGLEHAYPDLDTLVDAADRTDDDVGTERLTPALHLMQALDRRHGHAGPAVYCLTSRAQPVALGGAGLQVNQAPLIGFFRVAINEFGHLRLRLIDVDGSAAAWEALVPELLSSSRDEEVALRAEGRFASRLSRSKVSQRQGGADVDGPGHERLAREVRRPPGPGEVEVALIGAPMTASNTGWTLAHGLGAGRWNTLAVVVAAGPQLASPRPGDRVLLDLAQPPKQHLTLPAAQTQRCASWPANLDEAWRRLPLIAAYHGLHEVARLEKGEHILIHDAASVLGQAALSVARWCGATVHATVHHADDIAALQRQGVAHVHAGGSLGFVDGVRAVCGDRGLDVVFSSQGGEVDEHSLALLGPFGRFLDASAHGAARPVAGTTARRQPLSASVDLAPMIALRPDAFAILSARVDTLLENGALTAPAWRSLDSAALSARQGEPHATGATAWFEGGRGARESAAHPPPARFPAEASYLITGGFGGFGLALADWLVRQGARHLVLIGRQGAASADARQAVARLEAAGARVLVVAADISRRDDVQCLFARLAAEAPPLKGIFHAAAVLDDAAIKTLDASKFRSAMDPKAKGAWLLHQFSQGLALDHFVLFSSVGSLVGNPGQSTYVAANAFLDSLAHARAAQGLAATSINWGALGQVGMAARHKGVEDYLNRMGFGSFTPQQAIGVMDKILQWQPTVIGASIMDWRMLRDAYPAWGDSPRNSRVMAEAASQAGGGRQGQLAELALLDSLARFDRISSLFTDLLSEILRLPPHKLDPSLSLLNLGMDSLMAIEIQAATHKRIGVKVSALELMKGSSITELVQRFSDIIDKPLPPPDAEPPRAVAPLPPEPSEGEVLDLENMDLMLDELSDEELDRVLTKLTHQGTQDEVELS
jgi:acyl transferase domain-containing protein/NAD(P)-dependent dehydrogenase (short-subunit alcohol dehydrogenase family)/acyl carrier protein